MHSPDKLKLKTYYYGLSQFYQKKVQSLPCITSKLQLHISSFENITIFQWCELLNHLLTPSRSVYNPEKVFFRKNSSISRAVCECFSLRLIQIACGLLYRQNKKCRYLFYRFCVNFTGRINSASFYKIKSLVFAHYQSFLMHCVIQVAWSKHKRTFC